MSILKRLSASLTARVEKLVNDIENHDAVVEAGVKDARQAYAKAKVRRTRLVQEGERLRRKLAELRESGNRWQHRALTTEEEDTALECLRRSNLCSEQAEILLQALERHQTLEAQLDRKLEVAGRRVDQLAHQRQLMRSREATADAAACLAGLEQAPAIELENVFERWEVSVTEAELAAGQSEASDVLDSTFQAGEEREELKAQLVELRHKKKGKEAKHED